VSVDRYAAALSAAGDRAFAGRPASTSEIERYLDGLHLEDLALACACIDGDEQAWQQVIVQCRPALRRAADALDATGEARDLAESIYGELYGTSDEDGRRRSLFTYFHGRSSLTTWLRAVLAQRFVDRLRATKREAALPDDDSIGSLGSAVLPAAPERDEYVVAMQAALQTALAELDGRDRLRLACYYAQGLTLAEIGRLLREHEATVSRQLARTRRNLRSTVERHLKEHARLTDEAIAECCASLAADAGPLDLRQLFGPDMFENARPGDPAHGVRKKPDSTRSKREQIV
jgi:RNA polymerase sigma-70 factor (ECF subfamily)